MGTTAAARRTPGIPPGRPAVVLMLRRTWERRAMGDTCKRHEPVPSSPSLPGRRQNEENRSVCRPISKEAALPPMYGLCRKTQPHQRRGLLQVAVHKTAAHKHVPMVQIMNFWIYWQVRHSVFIAHDWV